MASIATAIKLNDQMSNPIRSITNAMNMMLSAWDSLESSTSDGLNIGDVESIRSELDKASRAMENIEDNANQAARGVDRMDDEQQQFNRHVQQGANAMDGLGDQIMGAVGAYVSLQSLGKLVNLSDEFTQTTARLNMINDGAQTTEELFGKISASANRSRASISNTADLVAKLSLNAGDAFASNNEAILFAENLNKLYAIAGTEQAAMQSSALQLTQALGSGVLRGEEFNAVFEAAPNIMQVVADYMNVPIGKLREMAAEGQITANTVKYALLNATDQIDQRFQSMPMTWQQVWTQVMNALYYATIPVLNAINWMAQNWSNLAPIIGGVVTVMGLYLTALGIYKGLLVASAAAEALRGAAMSFASGATFAATAQQYGFNSALLACPITWIVLGIILLIVALYAAVNAWNEMTGESISATGILVGALMTAVAFIWNLFVALVGFLCDCINAVANPWIQFANFFANIFNAPIQTIIYAFRDLATNILNTLFSIADAIDTVFGSNLSAAVGDWQSSLDAMVYDLSEKYGEGSYQAVAEEWDLKAEDFGISPWAYNDAFNWGYYKGEKLEANFEDMFAGFKEFSMDDLLKNPDGSNTWDGKDWSADIGEFDAEAWDPNNFKDWMPEGGGNAKYPSYDELMAIEGNTDEIKSSAGSIEQSLDITNENLKYLRDLAEQETINRFTTAEIKVEMGGVNNTVNQNTDLDGVIDYMVTGVQEAMERVAEGVHN